MQQTPVKTIYWWKDIQSLNFKDAYIAKKTNNGKRKTCLGPVSESRVTLPLRQLYRVFICENVVPVDQFKVDPAVKIW